MDKSKTLSAIESIKALRGGAKPVPEKKAEIDKLKKTTVVKKGTPGTGKGRNYVPKGLGLGGTREGSGRKTGGTSLQRRLNKTLLATHFGEEIDVRVKDPKTGIEHVIKKPRVIVQVERLFQAGMQNGIIDAGAIDKWLNRALGKAPQPLIGDEEEDPIQVDTGLESILDKIYPDEDDD